MQIISFTYFCNLIGKEQLLLFLIAVVEDRNCIILNHIVSLINTIDIKTISKLSLDLTEYQAASINEWKIYNNSI